MKPQQENQEVKKKPLNPDVSKSDKTTENNPSKYPNKYPDEDPGKEFEAGEKEGDFPPDTEMNNGNQQGNS